MMLTDQSALCHEIYGAKSTERVYNVNKNHILCSIEKKRHTSGRQIFSSIFLPQGYPDSVSSDYLIYQIWDTVQAFCSSITGSLATHALLKGVGVGDDNATVMAATITWIMQRGAGMVGQILFAWLQGSYFDSDCKRWRLFADILCDISLFLDNLAPYFPDVFTVTLCISGVCKSLVGVAGGATRAALTQHQAIRNNISDVSAKDGSQETVVNLAALIASLILLPLVAGNQMIVWTIFCICTGVHIFANYKAVRSVVMATFNEPRFHFVTQQYLQYHDQHRLMTLKDANTLEPVVFPLRRRFRISLGCSLNNIINIIEDYESLFTLYKNQRYILAVDKRQGHIYIVLHDQATAVDQMMAMFQVEVIEMAANNRDITHNGVNLNIVKDAWQNGSTFELLQTSLHITTQKFLTYLALLELEGWVTSYVLLNCDEWRLHWGDSYNEKNKLL